MTDTPEAVRLADWLEADACDLEAPRQAAALLRRIPDLEAEVQEQARLNGMGAERELALMAQVSWLEAYRNGLNAARFAYASEFGLDEEGQPDVGSIHQNIRALKAERDQLREAIKKQSNAVTLFQKVASENARHSADANLLREADLSTAEAKSVAEANAILTAENDQLRAELENVRVPEGWKLVPVEPTREMLDRGSHNVNCNYHYGTMETIAKHAYKAMLTAAPTPPNADQKGQ